MLSFFRSHHDNQLWLSSLTTILDSCALVIAGADSAPTWQAQLTRAMARHTVFDLSQIFNSGPGEIEAFVTDSPSNIKRAGGRPRVNV